MAVRTYGFIIVAVILIAVWIITAILKIPKNKWAKRLLRTALLMTIVFCVFGALLFPGLSSVKTTGSFQYESVIYQIEDMDRKDEYNPDSNRKLSVLAFYPVSTEQKCPLVVFSHGGISLKTSNISLYEELASHGYIVLSIDHTYQAISTVIDGKTISMDPGFRKEILSEDSHKDAANSYECYQKWLPVRIKDIDFTIDDAIKKANIGDSFFTDIDTDRIAAAGHSLGGAAAYGTARQRTDIKAVVALESPYLYDITGVENGEFTWNDEEYRCAMLNIYSDTGMPLVENDHKYYQNKKYLNNERSVAYYHVDGANHYTLTDLVRTSPFLCRILGGSYSCPGYDSLAEVNTIVLDFLQKHI